MKLQGNTIANLSWGPACDSDCTLNFRVNMTPLSC